MNVSEEDNKKTPKGSGKKKRCTEEITEVVAAPPVKAGDERDDVEDGPIVVDEGGGEESKVDVRPMFVGMPKSRKPWKKGSEKASRSLLRNNPPLRVTFEERMLQKKEQDELKARLRELQDEKKEKVDQQRKALLEKRKRKELNTLKSTGFEVVKNTTKIKQWSKKARERLKKLPPELFHHILEKK